MTDYDHKPDEIDQRVSGSRNPVHQPIRLTPEDLSELCERAGGKDFLASVSGVSRTTVNYWLTGETHPEQFRVARIVGHYGLPERYDCEPLSIELKKENSHLAFIICSESEDERMEAVERIATDTLHPDSKRTETK